MGQSFLTKGLFTLTDPTPILLPILIQVTQECTVILSESDTI